MCCLVTDCHGSICGSVYFSLQKACKESTRSKARAAKEKKAGSSFLLADHSDTDLPSQDDTYTDLPFQDDTSTDFPFRDGTHEDPVQELPRFTSSSPQPATFTSSSPSYLLSPVPTPQFTSTFHNQPPLLVAVRVICRHQYLPHDLLVLLHNQPPLLVAVRVIWRHQYLPHLFTIQLCHLQWDIFQWYLLTLCTLTDQHIQFRLFFCVYDDVCVNFSISCTSHTGLWIPE